MSQCRFRGFYATYKPRSQVGLGKGSQEHSQRVVEPSVQFVQIADERMGFVQVSCCVFRRVSEGCRHHSLPNAHNALVVLATISWPAPSESDPLAPHPTPSAGRVWLNFSPTFPDKGLVHNAYIQTSKGVIEHGL